MKRNILIAILCIVGATGLQAQVLVKHGENKETIEFGNDKLVKMEFNSYDRESNGDNILFIFQSGNTMTFDIDEIYALGFAADFTEIEAVTAAGETAILYDAATATVHIVNAEEKKGNINIFNAEGRLVKSGKGITLSVADLTEGLYIVSYNQKLNVKIVKK